MQFFRVRLKASQYYPTHLFSILALAVVTSLTGFAPFELVPSSRAEQANPQVSSPTTMTQDQGEILKRLESVEKELEQRKVERDQVRLERAKRLAEQKKKEREDEVGAGAGRQSE